MSNGKTTEDVRCELHQFERNRYFFGKLMTVRDFEVEQRYVREHRHLHNQSLHGWGVVCGLTVEPKGGTGNESKVVVKPGVALDCCGREIVVAKDHEVDLRDFQGKIGTVEATGKTVFLCIQYDECDREPVPALANVSTCEEVCEYNRIQEKIAFELLTELPTEPKAVPDPCEVFTNLRTARSEIKEGETVIAEFERATPFWVQQGDVFEVRTKITPTESGNTILLADVLPSGFTLVDGSLEMEVADTAEGKVINSTYLVKVDSGVTPSPPPYQITGTGQVLQSPLLPPADLAPSTVTVIPVTELIEERVQRVLFNTQFVQCPHCAGDLSSQCVVLASITLQPQDSSFVVGRINTVTFDATRGIHRRLVYPTPLIVELLKCLRNQFTELGAPIAKPGAPEGLNVSTGRVIFENVNPGDFRFTPEPGIPHGLDVNDVAIVMAVEVFGQNGNEPFVIMGNLAEFSLGPSLAAAYNPNNKEFLIALRDLRPDGSGPFTWVIRWWVIPKTLDQPDVTIPPGEFFPREFLLARLVMRPGITVRDLASDLRAEPSEIQPELDRLREAGRIRVEGERLFLVSERVTPPPRPELRERIIESIRSTPGGSTLTRLTEGLGVDLAALEPEVGRLVDEGVIRRGPRGRFTIP